MITLETKFLIRLCSLCYLLFKSSLLSSVQDRAELFLVLRGTGIIRVSQ